MAIPFLFILMYSIKEHLPHELILSKISDYEILQYYFPFDTTKQYLSPFRKDTRPSLSFYKKGDEYLWTDFGEGSGGNWLQFLTKLFNLDYFSTCRRINEDLKLGLFGEFKNKLYKDKLYTSKHPKIVANEQIKKEIKFTAKPFTLNDLKFWNSYSISENDLKNNEIYSIKKLWVTKNGVLTELPVNKNELIFAYRFILDNELEAKKIYRPFGKFKWFGNISAKHIEGLGRLQFKNDSVIITKSRKDFIILSRIFEDVVNTQNELPSAIPLKLDNFFDSYYKNRYVNYDSDSVGKENCTKLNERGYKWINVPNDLYEKYKLKDFADVIQYFGYKEGYKILEEEIKKKIQ